MTVAYVEAAIEALRAYIDAELPTYLAQVETDQALTAGSLGRPVDVIDAFVETDNRAPLVVVYDDGFRPYGPQSERICEVDCVVAIVLSGSTDMTSGARKARRWMTALIRSIHDAPTLDGEVISCVLEDGAFSRTFGDQAAMRIVYVVPMTVLVQGD